MSVDNYKQVLSRRERSTFTVCHGLDGKGNIFKGAGLLSRPFARHEMHLSRICLVCSSIWGNHIF